jgi:hypothetical protein
MDMTNEELVKKIKELLKTNANLEFLLGLKRKELELWWHALREG